MAGRPFETRSPIGCASLGLLALAPECDEYVEPIEGAPPPASKSHRPMTPAKPTDEVPSDLCWKCGMIGKHTTMRACIDALRSELGIRAFHPPGNPAKRRAAGAH